MNKEMDERVSKEKNWTLNWMIEEVNEKEKVIFLNLQMEVS